MPTRKLTKSVVDAAQPGPQDVIVWDSELKGFGVKVTPRGSKTFFLYYRTHDGRQRRPAIGAFGALTVEEARKIATQWAAAVQRGEDPSLERQLKRQQLTFGELCDRYLSDYAGPHKKAKSAAEDKRNINKHLRPRLGKLKAPAIGRADIARLHAAYKETPVLANRLLALLSKMFALAEEWGIRPDGSNPCRHTRRYAEKARKRYLTPDELQKLAEVLGEAHLLWKARVDDKQEIVGYDRVPESERETKEAAPLATPVAIAAIRLLIFTGCRMNEILTLRWEHLDAERGVLELPDSKTGAKTVPLNSPALDLLAELAETRGASPWVLPGRSRGHVVNIEAAWRRIRLAGGFGDVHIHDLRHSFGAVAAGLGLGLPIVGALLGHSQARTTQRYAHVAPDPAKAASEAVGSRLVEIMAQGKAEVVEIEPSAPEGRKSKKEATNG